MAINIYFKTNIFQFRQVSELLWRNMPFFGLNGGHIGKWPPFLNVAWHALLFLNKGPKRDTHANVGACITI